MSLNKLSKDIEDWCGTPIPATRRGRRGCATS